MKDIVLSGIQGSGKGTQCDLLLKKFEKELSYFEAGGILRALQSKPNAIGEYVNDIVNSGKLLPYQFMVKVFDLFLFGIKEGNSILVDGFPRQIKQMDAFLEIMKQNNRQFTTIILDVSKETAIKRLSSRRMCKTCGAVLSTEIHDCDRCYVCNSVEIYQREDDKNLSSIETRLNLFEEETRPVLKYLEKIGLAKIINGDQSPEKVFEDIVAVICS